MTIIRRMRFACWVRKATRQRASVPTRTRTSMYERARTYTHTHTQKYVILIAFPRQQWFRERASLLRYTYIARLVLLMNFILKTQKDFKTFG